MTCKDCIHWDVCEWADLEESVCKDFKDKAHFVEQKWININDRLPTDNDMLISSVLIYTEDGGVAEAGYDIKNNRFLQYRWSDPNPEVLYWMPLPKPPKGASNETD